MRPDLRSGSTFLLGGLVVAAFVACSHGGGGGGGDPGADAAQVAKIELGLLGISCGTCHDPFLGWGDGRPQGKGVQDNSLDTPGHDGLLAVAGPRFKTVLTPRNSPTVYNSHLFQNLFWDGRAGDTHHQGQFPFEASAEMNSSWDEHILPLMQGDPRYLALFSAAYGEGTTPTRVLGADALGAYMDTISVFDTPYDAFLAGDEGALSPQQREGHDLFFGKAGCGECHPAPLLTDGGFHNVGAPSAGSVALNLSVGGPDLGFGVRNDITALPGGVAEQHDDPEDYAKFKTPQLRMVAVTGPYMHNGCLTTLEDVVDFFDAGGGSDLSGTGTKDARLVPLGLTQAEKGALVAFLGEALLGTEIR
jgi:cytochrome c peroxidase